jgi:hypothetical protein
MATEKTLPTLKDIPYRSDVEKIDRVLQVYSAIKGIQLREFEKNVLKYYLVYGYCSETKKTVMEDLGIKDGNIRVVDTHLREKGFLNHGKTNQRKSTLSIDMEQLRQSFVIDNKDYYVLTFKRQ